MSPFEENAFISTGSNQGKSHGSGTHVFYRSKHGVQNERVHSGCLEVVILRQPRLSH